MAVGYIGFQVHQDLPATIRLVGPTIFGTLVEHCRSHLCAQSHCGLDCVPSASRTAQCQRSKWADQCDSQQVYARAFPPSKAESNAVESHLAISIPEYADSNTDALSYVIW
jgi:hypothetical protein